MSDGNVAMFGGPIADYGDEPFCVAQGPMGWGNFQRVVRGENDPLIGHLVVGLDKLRWAYPFSSELGNQAARYHKWLLRLSAYAAPKAGKPSSFVARKLWTFVLRRVWKLFLAQYAQLAEDHLVCMSDAPKILGVVVDDAKVEGGVRFVDVPTKTLRAKMRYAKSRRRHYQSDRSDWMESEARYSQLAALHWAVAKALHWLLELNLRFYDAKILGATRLCPVMSSVEKLREEMLHIAPAEVVDELLRARGEISAAVKLPATLAELPASFELATSVRISLSAQATNLALRMLMRSAQALKQTFAGAQDLSKRERELQILRHERQVIELGDWYALWAMSLPRD